MPRGTLIDPIKRNLAFQMLIYQGEEPENIWRTVFQSNNHEITIYNLKKLCHYFLYGDEEEINLYLSGDY